MPDSSVAAAAPAAVDVEALLDLAIRGLQRMFDQPAGLFCHRLLQRRKEWVQEGLSPRYSLMTLLGLRQAEQAGLAVGFDVHGLTSKIADQPERLSNLGDLGCLLWATAEIVPEALPSLWPRLRLETALRRYPDAQHTMELAWLLSGLAAAKRVSAHLSGLDEMAARLRSLLLRNRGDSGLFGHLHRKAGATGLLRGHIGSFADQVYPICALVKFAEAYGDQESQAALTIAKALCALQGPRGQWWWHYNAQTGKVVSTYPVYSVHQHAMGPMALFAATEASAENFRPNIFRGLAWLSDNELSIDMRELSCPLVWRGVAQTGLQKWRTRVDAVANGQGAVEAPPAKLSLISECRPYELGWLLYAFSKPSRRRL